MKKETKEIHKETLIQVITGLSINYPLNLVLLYIFIEWLKITNALVLGTTITAIITVVAYIRIFCIRYWFSKKRFGTSQRDQ